MTTLQALKQAHELTETFSATFNRAPMNTSQWRLEKMRDALHRSGNKGIDRDGRKVAANSSVMGKRWAAWYDDYHDKTVRIDNGLLEMGGYAVKANDPTRRNYEHNDIAQPYGDWRLYTGWIDTWARVWSEMHGRHITDPTSPDITFGPDTYLEMRVCFERMRTPSFRGSAWFMPAYDKHGNMVASNAYDDDPDDVELDLFEYDPANPHVLMMKVVGGDVGDTEGGMVDLRRFGIDISKGWHTIAVHWQVGRLEWYVDGVHVQTETKRVPEALHYFCITREMNSGAKPPSRRKPHEIPSNPPYIPDDDGLFAKSVIESLDTINDDVMLVEYVVAYDVRAANDSSHRAGESFEGSQGVTRRPVTITQTASSAPAPAPSERPTIGRTPPVGATGIEESAKALEESRPSDRAALREKAAQGKPEPDKGGRPTIGRTPKD